MAGQYPRRLGEGQLRDLAVREESVRCPLYRQRDHRARILSLDDLHDRIRRQWAGDRPDRRDEVLRSRSEEHTSELQSLMRISYAVFCLKKKQRSTTLASQFTSK